MDSAAIREFLYSLSAQQLLTPFNDVVMGMYQSPSPIADGAVFPRSSWHEAFAQADGYNPVPLMLGANRDEFKLFMAGDTDDYVDLRFGKIPTPKDPNVYQRDARYLSDLWRAAAVDEVALRLVEHRAAPVYAYRFDWDDWPRLPFINLRELVGAGHGVEIMFMFGSIADRPWLRFLLGRRRFNEINELSDAMRKYWIAFATDANPNAGNAEALPVWSAWPLNDDGNADTLLILNTPVATATHMQRNIVSIDSMRERMLNDPDLTADDGEMCRLYARLFIYGIQGSYWDTLPHRGLAPYQPGGAQRTRAEGYRPALTR